jgi:hypothetical protein
MTVDTISDQAAEQAVLGAILQSADVFPAVLETGVGAGDFTARRQVIFECLLDLYGRGKPVDAVTVSAELLANGELSRVGGGPYLHDLISSVPAVTSASYYAALVVERAERRRAVEAAQRALQSLGNPAVDTATALERLTTDLDQVRRTDGTGTGRPGQSWQPVDLGPILRGEHKRPEPVVGVARSDGLRFLYPGKEHSVIGEMESGKSWFCLASCAAELTKGNHVLYVHFEEADPTDTLERLLLLGVPDWTVLERFRFVGPDEPVRSDLLAALLTPAPTLVVLDGVNEAMSLHGHAIREEDGAAAFRRHLVKPCTAVGAATLAADHVVKDREKQGRGPLGSVHKGNAVNGSLILIENAEPFGRGQRGRSHVFVTKDRPGHLRQQGRPTRTPGKTFMGEMVVDDTLTRAPDLDFRLWAPAEPDDDAEFIEDDPRAADDEEILTVIRKLLEGGESANVRNVRAKSTFGKDRTDRALDRLLLAKQIEERKGPKNARVFSVAEPDPPKESE